jgi:hypothetical protein
MDLTEVGSEDVNWIELAHSKAQLYAFVNVIMNLLVS